MAAYCLYDCVVFGDGDIRMLKNRIKVFNLFSHQLRMAHFQCAIWDQYTLSNALYLLIELIPVFMAVYLLSQAPSGKLTTALRQLPLPSSIRLTVIVILRFIPTVASEFSDVLDAMKTRGLMRSPFQVILHPLNTFEYVIVPMVFRSLKIADELAASSVVRGIESPYKKKGYYLNKMAVSDGIMIVLFVSTAIICILL